MYISPTPLGVTAGVLYYHPTPCATTYNSQLIPCPINLSHTRDARSRKTVQQRTYSTSRHGR